MSKTVKFILAIILSAALAAVVIYCVRVGRSMEEVTYEMDTLSEAAAEEELQAAILMSAEAEKAWQSETTSQVILDESQKNVNITEPGIYHVSGVLTEGQLNVDCDGDVALVLESVSISNSGGPAICITNADRALIFLPEGSLSTLKSGEEVEITASAEETLTKTASSAGNASSAETASGAVLYARDTLVIAGSGKLSACGYINNAIATTDHLILLGGELELTAVNNGLKGKDSVTVMGGTLSVQSGNDGIKSSNDTDEGCGNITIRGGEISIVSLGDGVQAEKDLTVEGGVISIASGKQSIPSAAEMQMPTPLGDAGGMEPPDALEDAYGMEPPDAPEDAGGMERFLESMGDPDEWSDPGDIMDMFDREWINAENSEASTKGLKCGGDMEIIGGVISIDSTDDCLHAEGCISLAGGTMSLSSGDDGIHADDTVMISEGVIDISKSHEGIEGSVISISGGVIFAAAGDDGLNAGSLLQISGGELKVDADGDGLDSNGDMIIEGGNIVVDGPTNNGNGALDCGTETGGRLICNGGTILAVGASGMAETFDNDSAQCSFILTCDASKEAGTAILILNEAGESLYEYVSAKSFDSLVFSSPELEIGETCTVYVGEESQTITLENISNGRSYSSPGSKGTLGSPEEGGPGGGPGDGSGGGSEGGPGGGPDGPGGFGGGRR